MSHQQIETPDLESSTDEYAQRFAGPVGDYFLEVQTDAVRKMLPSPEVCTILDIGGGHAQLVAPLANAGYNVTVVASDATCRTRLDRIVGPDRYQLLTGNLLELPCERDAYDVVLAFRLLPHLNNWHQFVSEICRVAKSSLIVDYPDLRSINVLASRMFALKRRIEKNTRTYKCFSRSQILSELEKHRFYRDSIQAQFFFPMALHRLMRKASLSRLIERIARVSGLTRVLGSPVILKAAPA